MVVVGGMLLIFLFDIGVNLLCNRLERRCPILRADFAFVGDGGDRVHFLNVGNSDCVLLESRGRFAMVDSGWGSDNPSAAARRPGYEARVLEYLKRVAADSAGRVTLEFVLPTHYHYDHAGGFARILADPAVTVKQVFLRPLLERNQHGYELHSWGIRETRRRIEAVAAARGFSLTTQLPDKLSLGGMTLRFFNLDSYENPRLQGENDNSVVTLVRAGGGQTALLTGDITATHGLERRVAGQVKRQLKQPSGGYAPLDLLKVPHHGYTLSSSAPFLAALRPKCAVVTNGIGQIYPNVKWNLALVSRTTTISCVRENGLIVTFLPDGKLSLQAGLHLGE